MPSEWMMQYGHLDHDPDDPNPPPPPPTANQPLNPFSHFPMGYSPLYVALRARKWDTARLILEIAQKQFMKEEEDEQHKQFSSLADDRDDDDEDSDTDSCASDQTETRPIGYTNLAKRFHTVSVKVKPNQLFVSDGTNWATGSISGFRAFPGATSADPMTLAILENDVEAFNQIADMMEGLEEPMAIPVHLQQTIMATDSPEILDAFIRRTGEGLSLPKPKVRESTDDAAQVQPHDGYKHYLGLDVDGKKRKDLLAVLTAVESSNGGQGPVPARRVGALEQAGLEQTQGIGYSIIVGPPATDLIGSSSGVPYSLFAPYPSFAPRLFYR
ncbi:hypothetical protein M407DRAFT_211262 [Tulasnella calospora MUT 4182]|uniref:Uncharacterized protein n=1 Tax=Tulasnella calospora MUT 4182 TaxID=1051891 RepID=A0A0C3QFQ5_9AGAM|nr:hypothetical protein M407DRAFT_211262 [Tulasnella calospora MUT 4182]